MAASSQTESVPRVVVETAGEVVTVPSRALRHLFTHIRDENTSAKDFAFYSSRIMRILAEEGIAHLPAVSRDIVCCGTKAPFSGEVIDMDNVCAVSIVRAGDSLLESVRACCPDVSVGKILIQRDESTAEKLPKLFYCKLPPKVATMRVLLTDPMLATGGSSKMAVKSLLDRGVLEENIIFLNVIACPEGLKAFHDAYPRIKIVTACIDDGMNEHKYIVPGLGDFGDRFFNTI